MGSVTGQQTNHVSFATMFEDDRPTLPESFEDCRGRVKVMLETPGFNH